MGLGRATYRGICTAFIAVFLNAQIAWAQGGLVISEVMWDGIEYVELANLSDQEINLESWSLVRQKTGENEKEIVSFDEEVRILPGEYLLIEKREEATSVVGALIASGLTLLNTGELLSLKNNLGEVVSSVDGQAGWPAGENTSEGVAMEWNWEVGWYTSTAEIGGRLGSPGVENSEPAVNMAPEAVISGDEEGLVGEDFSFTAEDSSDLDGHELEYAWDFGDGYSDTGVEVNHEFEVAGSYTVSLIVSDDELEDEASLEVEVIKPEFSDEIKIYSFLVNPKGSDVEGEYIELINEGDGEVNLEGWILDDVEAAGSSMHEMESVAIGAGEVLRFERSETGIALNNSGDSVRLLTPDGGEVDSFQYTKTVPEGAAYILEDGELALDVDEEDLEDEEESEGEVAGESIEKIELADIREFEVGMEVETSGVVSAPPGILGKTVMYLAGSGVQVYFSKKDWPEIKLGDVVKVVGEISQAGGETRLKLVSSDSLEVSKSGEKPEPHILETGEIDEEEEGWLVTIAGEIATTSGNTFYVDDGSGEIKVYIKDSTKIDKPKMKKGTKVTITGVVSETRSGYRILPRFQEDVRLGLVAGLTSFPATGYSWFESFASAVADSQNVDCIILDCKKYAK